MMQIEDDKKVDVLLAILKERYKAAHKMRERSFKFSIWLMGLAVAFIWLIIKESPFMVLQKVILTIFVLSMGALFWFFVRSIRRGFNNNWKVMIKVEEKLGCWEDNIYGQDTLYPEEYRTTKKISPHFASLYSCLLILCIIAIALIWTPCKSYHTKTPTPAKSEQVTIQKDSPQLETTNQGKTNVSQKK